MKRRFKKILTLTLSLALLLSMTPVFAAEGSTNQTSPVKLTAQPIVFNVTVPTGFPVDVDAQGEVTVATDAKIENHSAAPISIAGVQVNPIPDWSVVPMNKDFKGTKIGTKEFGFVLNSDEVPANGTVSLTKANWPSINGGSSLSLVYDSVVAPQKDAIGGNKIADVVFTIGWDTNDFTLSSETLSIEKGSSSKLSLVGADSAVWSSSNETVATVDQAGNITSLDWGTSTITATANGVSKTCEVTVPKVFNGLTLNTNNIELYETQTQQLTATDKYRSDTIWSSSNESVASVDSTGLVTMKSPGAAVITASKDSFTAECNVKVNPITLSNTTLSIEKGKTSQLGLPSGFTATWNSSNTSVATVDQTGKITALDWGTATIAAIINGVSKTCEVTVPKIQTGVEMNVTSKTLGIGNTFQLTATSKYRAGTVWSSSNPEIAIVNQGGLVTGVSDGTTTITVTQGEFAAICKITVNPPAIGTKYTEGNYEYSYGEQYYNGSWKNSNLNGWGVRILNNAQTSYVQPLETIQGKPVVSYYALFRSYPNSILTLEGTWTNKNVTDMNEMFTHSKATSLDLSSFNTSKVTSMNEMFSNCSATSLGLSSFDTSSVTSMANMFSYSPAATLDLSSFDTSKVTDMQGMFFFSFAKTGYAKTQVDANKFNTSSKKPSALTFIVK